MLILNFNHEIPEMTAEIAYVTFTEEEKPPEVADETSEDKTILKQSTGTSVKNAKRGR